MYATIQHPRVTGRRVIQHGRTLYLPSSRSQVNGVGLGDFMDTLKNFGKGVLSITTGGIYDLNKNRFYVPFSGGQVRNFMQGMTNFSTLGLVNTDKFFNSQTMRTVGNIGAGIEAAAVAAVGASALTGGFSGAAGTVATQGGAVTGATSGAGAVLPSTASNLQAANLAHMTGIPSTAVPSSTGLFATAPITGSSYASIPTVANSFGTAAAVTSPSLLSQIGSGISNFFGKLPSALSSVSQVMQAAQPIIRAVAPQQQEMAPGSGVMVGDPNSMYGGFMPPSYGDPSQGLFPGGGVLLPNNYGGGGGGGVMLPSGGGGGQEGEQLVADGGGLMNHPAVPYIAVVMVLGAAYFIMKKK